MKKIFTKSIIVAVIATIISLNVSNLKMIRLEQSVEKPPLWGMTNISVVQK